VDVGQWLEGETSAGAKTAPHRIRSECAFGDTDEIKVRMTTSRAPASPVESTAGAVDEPTLDEPSSQQPQVDPPHVKRGIPVKKPAGKLPPIKPTAKDSRDAAADMLNKIRRRRDAMASDEEILKRRYREFVDFVAADDYHRGCPRARRPHFSLSKWRFAADAASGIQTGAADDS